MTRPIHSEMPRPIHVDRIPANGSREVLAADAGELRLLAARFRIPAIHALTATLDLARWRGSGVMVTGFVEAEIEQVCVVSLEPFRGRMREPVERYFIPSASTSSTSSKSLDDADIDAFDHGIIDLGELACETVALGLDPYPRRPGIAFEAGNEPAPEPETSPFAALAALRKNRT